MSRDNNTLLYKMPAFNKHKLAPVFRLLVVLFDALAICYGDLHCVAVVKEAVLSW